MLFIPSFGKGNWFSTLVNASMNTLESFAVPSQPVYTNVNIISKEHAHITF